MSPQNPEQSRWFAEEVLPHEAKLRAWLRGRFPAVTDVDDLVQDAYARLMEAHATGPIACPRALLFVTARNLALNHLRHERGVLADHYGWDGVLWFYAGSAVIGALLLAMTWRVRVVAKP